jgi:hypothetical protein
MFHNQLLGPFISEDLLTGDIYLQLFLQKEMLHLLENVLQLLDLLHLFGAALYSLIVGK